MSSLPFQSSFTRAAALAQWREFLPRVPAYGASRNRVAADRAGVSQLSPAFASRLVTEDEVIAETLASFPAKPAEKWLQEIFWRRYWKGWLEQHPGIWTFYRERLVWLHQNSAPAVLERAREVTAGRSGVALMDRFAWELSETGYLHNQARLWWASFWVHVERLPWELGAHFFFEHLRDADAASNTLSWRWVAGWQTRGKHYLVRRSELERLCAPELLADTTGLERLADDKVSAQPAEFPKPDEDDETAIDWTARETAAGKVERFSSHPSKPPELANRHGLWIHGEDVTPELGNLGSLKPVASVALVQPGGSQVQASFRRAVLTDATQRVAAHFGTPATLQESANLTDALVKWAREHQLATVCAMAPNVGPLADELPTLRKAFAEAEVELLLFRRHTDFELWPHAKEGYFTFWEAAQRWMQAKQKRGELPRLQQAESIQ